jgi:hypothetical protein
MQPEDALSTETFTSRFNRIISALLVGFAVVFTGVTALYRPEQAGRTFVGALLFAVIVHALLWRPRLAVDDEGVTVINVLSTVHVPWEALIAIEGRFSLVLRTPNRSVSVWCAPVAGKSTVYRSRRGEDRTTGAPVVDGRIRAADLPHTDSGTAGALVRARWQRLLEEDRVAIGRAETAQVRRSLHLVELATIAALVGFAASARALGI